MDTIRVPDLLHVLPGFGVAGIQVRLAHLINSFGPRYRHTIVALDGNLACLERVEPDNAVAVHPFRDASRNSLVRMWRIRQALAAQRPDLLLTYNWGSIEWAIANRFSPVSPHLHFEDGFGPDEADSQLWRRVAARRIALAKTRRIVVPSQTLVRLALDHWRLDSQRVLYIPNGIDADTFASGGDRDPLFERRPGDIVLGTVAPLRREKNIGRLIRAVARVKNDHVRLVIAGDGSERRALEREAGELLGDRALFIGAIDRPARFFRGLDIFALSSDTEQMPMTILEAMAMSLPIVAGAVGDVPLMIAEENRPFIVPKDDEAKFADAICRLATDAAMRSRLGEGNRRRVRTEFSLDRMVASYHTLLTSAVEGRISGGGTAGEASLRGSGAR